MKAEITDADLEEMPDPVITASRRRMRRQRQNYIEEENGIYDEESTGIN